MSESSNQPIIRGVKEPYSFEKAIERHSKKPGVTVTSYERRSAFTQ
jgi:hypothetical protein